MSPRELNFISDITKEIIKDVVGQKIIYYPISEIKTKTHEVYNEALKKIFDNPIIIDALVDNSFQTDTKIDKFGIDAQYKIEVYIQHRDLVEKGINVTIGDFFSFSDIFYEITERTFMRNIYGMAEHKDGIRLVGTKSRLGLFEAPIVGPTDISYTNPDAVQDVFVQQRGLKYINKTGEITGDVRDLVREGVLDGPLTGQKEVSELGDPIGVGHAFYDDDDIRTPSTYTVPSILLAITTQTSGGIVGETNLLREFGNVGSTITGTITRNYDKAAISSYTVEYRPNGTSTWTAVPGLSNVAVSGNPETVTITSTIHNDPTLSTATTIYYRVRVVDSYETTMSSTTSVAFNRVIFFGPSAAAPTTSNAVRALPDRIFINGDNPFILNTGSTNVIFTVAMPAPLTIDEVNDLDAYGFDITSAYISSTFSVADSAGTLSSYNVYTMTIGAAYTSNHRHEVTRT
jgi:hypothetical protein